MFLNSSLTDSTKTLLPNKILLLICIREFFLLDFIIYPENFTDKIIKLFGGTEIEIGDVEFDDRFIIKSNNEKFIAKLLNQDIRDFLLANYVANFKLTSNKSVDTLELNIVINELELSETKKVLEMFQSCVKMIMNE